MVQLVDRELDPARGLFFLSPTFASVDQAVEFAQPVACY